MTSSALIKKKAEQSVYVNAIRTKSTNCKILVSIQSLTIDYIMQNIGSYSTFDRCIWYVYRYIVLLKRYFLFVYMWAITNLQDKI